MSILVIEGDPGAIEDLVNELRTRNYPDSKFLSEVFLSEVLDVPDLSVEGKWGDFLYQLKYLIKHYIAKEDSE